MVKHSPPSYIRQNIDTLFPTLLEVLNDIPRIDFDPTLSWRGNYFDTCNFTLLTLSLRLGLV